VIGIALREKIKTTVLERKTEINQWCSKIRKIVLKRVKKFQKIAKICHKIESV
jgi:hypothetical protein